MNFKLLYAGLMLTLIGFIYAAYNCPDWCPFVFIIGPIASVILARQQKEIDEHGRS